MSSQLAAVQTRLRWLTVGVAAATSIVGLLRGVDFALGVAAGATVALVSYGALDWLVTKAPGGKPSRGACLAVLSFGLRYILLGLALYAIFAIWRASVMAVILGLSAPVAAIFIEWGLETYEELTSKRGDQQ